MFHGRNIILNLNYWFEYKCTYINNYHIIDSKPVEVSWKIVTELDVLRHMNKKAHFKQVYQKSAALNFLQKEAEAQQFDDY